MDTLVERAVGILEREPIDIYVNPTFLPDVIAKDYDTLWTEARMKKVVAARRETRRGHRDQRPLQAAQCGVHQDGEGGRLQVHLRHQQRRRGRPGALRVRPAR